MVLSSAFTRLHVLLLVSVPVKSSKCNCCRAPREGQTDAVNKGREGGWDDPDWKPSAHQSLSIILLLSKGRGKCDEKLIGQDKDRERLLTRYNHRQSRLGLGKILNSLPMKSE